MISEQKRRDIVGRTPMEKTLAEQLQRVLETLAVAESQAVTVQAMMREQRIFFGLDYDYLDDDIAHLKGKVRYMKLLAQHRREARHN
jgi:hypothetical protein